MLVYVDGNNNRYEIGEQLAYRPVTPAQSSSGTYSGGAPRTVPLAPAQHAELARLCGAIAADAENLIPDRPKGSGTVIRDDQRFVCRASSPHKAELERALRAMLDGASPG